ncbi:MAG: hydroxyacid aldolase [Aestuariivirga sp.]|uniref:HpcH/HpaI aldolase family protein n=1 Tax=Aestuariivirga sp. TaxID=2650926 RepID=UPI0025C01883|nr:aldolase/citrate lyase family protein [Aestuariivirga sp.]MCA3560640.1 hydroxyacid aldolase [Aestuariivirga sp.]
MAAAHFDLRARLASGGPFLFSWMTVPSAALAGQVARLPFDGVCLDMQHGMIGFPDAVGMIAAINAAGRPALVRSLWNDAATPGQCFDAGAACVIAPMVNSRAQAELLARAAKYPPVGSRSWGGYTAQQASGLSPAEYLREGNRMTMVFAMVETAEALENVEAIAATPGLDGLFVGPSDLSIALSGGAGIDKTGKDTLAAMARVAAAAKANGLVTGAFGGSPEVIRTYLGLGFTFLAAAVEVDLMQRGAAELRKALQD